MLANRIAHILRRSFGGFRRRPWLYALSILTLSAAFLSFAATLTAALNLDALLSRWVGGAELTVYLRGGGEEGDLDRLTEALAAVEGVERARPTSPAAAREQFARDLGEHGEMVRDLPADAFPASVSVHLTPELSRDAAARRALAARIADVELVADVEVYDDWYERLFALGLIGRLAAWGLGLLALVVAVLVVAATVRSGVHTRRREIQVLRFVGATDTYVRLPFLVEGALEAAFGMGLALAGLHLLLGQVERLVGDLLPLLGGGDLVRLTGWALAALFCSALAAGLAGARLSLRRLEEA